MKNLVNLDNLPRRKDGKIDWKNCNHSRIDFCYRDNIDSLYIERFINQYVVEVLFHNTFFEMNIESIKRACFGKLYNFAVSNNYAFKVGSIISTCDRNIKIIDTIRIEYNNGKTSKGYLVECLSCGYIYKVSEANLCRGDGCPLCSNHRIVVGINDLYTTCPEVAIMLKNPEDGYKYAKYSNKEVDFICPKCGKYIGKSYIHNVTRFGLSCPFCGDGVTYPNRLMNNVLSELNENFSSEIVFEWCKFQDYNNIEKISYGRYDFVVWDKKIIIEMDGGFGHGKDPHPYSRYSKDELIYRDKMKDKLAIDHDFIMIRIDCDYSSHNRLDYISNNIINSKLSEFYNFDDINWNKININCY